MARWNVIVIGTAVVLLACSCVVSEGKITRGITTSDQQFRQRYPELDISYYDEVVGIETIILDADRLYRKYFKRKKKGKLPDTALRKQAQEKYFEAIEKIMKLYGKTNADSLLRLKGETSSNLQDLLRETEEPG